METPLPQEGVGHERGTDAEITGVFIQKCSVLFKKSNRFLGSEREDAGLGARVKRVKGQRRTDRLSQKRRRDQVQHREHSP